MANAGCINAYDCNGCLIQTLQNLDSACIGVGVQYTAPNPLDDKRLDYIKYTDKCGCQCCLTDENEILIYATQGVIKNLTLTNDDVNEAIKIKWNDIFGSNRAKTIVRYKTGSYPVSITDGTLAVEETTKNQYSSTPFFLSGVLNETTYYITAFAVDSNNVVIGTQQTTITTSFGWHPSANTLARYKFENNLNDSSGNSRNLSAYTGSFTYGTASGGGKYVQLSSSNTANNINIPINFDGYTVSGFVNFGEIRGSGAQGIVFDIQSNDGYPRFRTGDGGINSYCGGSNWYSASTNTWYYLVCVIKNKVMYCYVNGQLKFQYNVANYSGTSAIFSFNGISDKSRSQYRVSAKLGNLIIEKTGRAGTDITKYFNKMKSLYGIS